MNPLSSWVQHQRKHLQKMLANRELFPPPRRQPSLLLSDFDTAIERSELKVYLQPQVNTVNDEVIGAEALIRWMHPQLGLITPDCFIPMLMKSGRNTELSLWILKACMLLSRDQPQSKKILISVNLSALDLDAPNFVSSVEKLLNETGARASNICLEITETDIMRDFEKCLLSISCLHQLGFTFSLDDFGTGYSSLSHLSKIPIDELKIDRSFIEQVHDPKQLEILKAIVHLGLALKLRLVAEGVADVATYELLASYGCHEAQGYLIAKPMPAIEFFAWMAACNGFWRCRPEAKNPV